HGFLRQRRADTLRESRRRHRAGLAAEHVATQLPAAARLAPLRVVVEPPQREARRIALQLAVEQRAEGFPICIMVLGGGHQMLRSRRSSWSSRGFSSASMASRARKIRERTVPIGQSILCAI